MDILSRVTVEDIQDLFLNIEPIDGKVLFQNVVSGFGISFTIKNTNELNHLFPVNLHTTELNYPHNQTDKFNLGNLRGCFVTKVTEHKHFYSYTIGCNHIDLNLTQRPIYFFQTDNYIAAANFRGENRVLYIYKRKINYERWEPHCYGL